MNNTQILVIVLILLALWIYFQSQENLLTGSEGDNSSSNSRKSSLEVQKTPSRSSSPLVNSEEEGDKLPFACNKCGWEFKFEKVKRIHEDHCLGLYDSSSEESSSEEEATEDNRERSLCSAETKFSTFDKGEETENSPVRKIKKEEYCKTLQEWLDWSYPTREEKEGVKEIEIYEINNLRKWSGIMEKLEGGELDLSEFKNVEIVRIVKCHLKTLLTKLNISGCSKLTDLFFDTELFLKNKIIGLENTSIIRLDCHGGNLLVNSKDPQFIWQVFIRRYNTSFPEMKLINVDDLTEIAQQVNSERIKDKEFLKTFANDGGIKSIEKVRKRGNGLWRVLDCLANQILGRCLIVQNRLYTDKDEVIKINEKKELSDRNIKKVNNAEYEVFLMELAQNLQCKAMNPKYPEASLYSGRLERVNKALSGDQELLNRLQDLPYLKEKYKLKYQ